MREALDLLVSAGLAERVPYRGVQVLQLTQSEIIDAYALRLLLESAAVRLAACSATPNQGEEILSLVEQTRELVTLQDMPRLRQLNKRFHTLIAEFSGNPLLARHYEMVSNIFPDWMLYEYMFRHPELLGPSLEGEYREHLAIAQAIAAHDPEVAARRAIAHIRNLSHELVQYLEIPEELLHQKEGQILPLLVPSQD